MVNRRSRSHRGRKAPRARDSEVALRAGVSLRPPSYRILCYSPLIRDATPTKVAKSGATVALPTARSPDRRGTLRHGRAPSSARKHRAPVRVLSSIASWSLATNSATLAASIASTATSPSRERSLDRHRYVLRCRWGRRRGIARLLGRTASVRSAAASAGARASSRFCGQRCGPTSRATSSAGLSSE